MSSNLKVNTILPSSGTTVAVSGIVSATSSVSIASSCTATTFYGSGANLTSLPAANLTGTLPAISGANLTNLNASAIASGTVPTARLGSGTASSSTFLAGDSTFKTITGTTINNNADNRLITGSGTANTLEGESTMTYTSSLLKLATGSSTSTDAELLHLVGGGTATRGLKISTGRASGASQNHGAAIYDAINSESSGYGSQHRFKIAGTDCFTIGYNSNFGYVGVNDTVPYPDAVSGNTVNTCLELGSPSGTDTSSVIKFIGRDGGGNANKCQIQWAGANNRFDITVNGNQALQIQPNKDVEVTDGNLVIGTSGHGIDFSATGDGASVSNKSEILDDYEEGSFTPTMSVEGQGSNASLALAIGTYTKVGAMVNIWIEAQFNGIPSGRSTSNAWQFGGLPFTSQAYTVAPSGLRDYRFPMIAMAVDTSGTYGSNGHFLFRLFDNQTAGRIEWQHSDLELKNASLFIQNGTMIQIHACYPDF